MPPESTTVADQTGDAADADEKSSISKQSSRSTNDVERTANDPSPTGAPDGGTAAWLVVLGCWCTSFCSFGWLNSISPFTVIYGSWLMD